MSVCMLASTFCYTRRLLNFLRYLCSITHQRRVFFL
jgi:hypothetical protein